MCCFSDNLGGSESPIDLENQLNDVDVQSKPLPDENSSTDDSKWNFVDMVKDFGVFSTLFVSGLIVYFLYNVSYYWPASKTFSVGLFCIYALILSLVILALEPPVYGSRDCCYYISVFFTLISFLFVMLPTLTDMWFCANASDANYKIPNSHVTIYAGAWIEIGGLTPVRGETAYLERGYFRTQERNPVGQDGVVRLNESSANMFEWEEYARLSHYAIVMVDMRLVHTKPEYPTQLTPANVKPTIILHGNRRLSVHGLPGDFDEGAYLNIEMPPDILVGGYTRPYVFGDILNHGRVINPIVKDYIYTSADVLLRTTPVDISEGGRNRRNQFGAFVLSGADYASLFEEVEEARQKGYSMFVSSDRPNVKNARIGLTVQCSELKKCGTCN
eukprot:928443_1